jgi:hypothetical protein
MIGAISRAASRSEVSDSQRVSLARCVDKGAVIVRYLPVAERCAVHGAGVRVVGIRAVTTRARTDSLNALIVSLIAPIAPSGDPDEKAAIWTSK